jgi:hypothetical protein
MNLFNFFKKKPSPENQSSLAIAAIFRNEKEYILEWLAWHISQGIQHFIIYDNESDDGTTELLQQLHSAGLIHFHSIERQDNVQRIAYSQIFNDYKNEFDLIAVIDADEFLMPVGTNSASDEINQLFKDPKVGGLAVNWRIFGSNDHQTSPNDPVLLSYTMAANDQRVLNHFIKSIYRTNAITQIFIHMGAVKQGYRYINTQGDDVIFSTEKTLPTPTENNKRTGVSQTISASRLRINHYAVKSYEEFINKKKSRGRADTEKKMILSDQYFKTFDLNDEKIVINESHIQKFKEKYIQLQKIFNQT